MKDIAGAIQSVQGSFPFQDYMPHSQYACANIAATILRHLPVGSRLLDFGAGPCDKTAVLSMLGYRCTAVDDLSDSWHIESANREAILSFAKRMGINFRMSETVPAYETDTFDMVILADVIEHMHHSPRLLFNDLIAALKPNGLVLITVPNAVNIRKRLAVLSGKTNYPPFYDYFWCDRWRGHVREYTKRDLKLLTEAIGLRCHELRACDHMIDKVPSSLRLAYKAITTLAGGWKDSWILVASKPRNWSPIEAHPERAEQYPWSLSSTKRTGSARCNGCVPAAAGDTAHGREATLPDKAPTLIHP